MTDVDWGELLGRSSAMETVDPPANLHRDQGVFITGAGGSFGSALTLQLAQLRPRTLLLLDASEQNLYELDATLKRLASPIRYVAALGSICDDELWLEHSLVGYNYRLPEIQCVRGLEQLRRVESILARRAEVAAWYDQGLRGNRDLILPELQIPEGRISWCVYVVRLSDRFQRHHRDAIVATLREQGIACGRYFAPIRLQPAYRDMPKPNDPLTVTEHVAQRSIALPFFNRISPAEVREVCGKLQDTVRLVSS
jgi:dTDP-4-amino-4,6-dideoxygalactose transaminase